MPSGQEVLIELFERQRDEWQVMAAGIRRRWTICVILMVLTTLSMVPIGLWVDEPKRTTLLLAVMGITLALVWISSSLQGWYRVYLQEISRQQVLIDSVRSKDKPL